MGYLINGMPENSKGEIRQCNNCKHKYECDTWKIGINNIDCHCYDEE